MNTTPRALTEGEVAQRLGVSAATLRHWRRIGEGPIYRRFGRSVRYLETDLSEYIELSRPGADVPLQS